MRLSLVRFSLGLALLAYYGFSLFHPTSYVGVPRFAGVEIPFLHLPETVLTQPFLVGFYIAGFLCAGAFASGYWTVTSGLALLLIHILFNGVAVPFGWGALVDPFLLWLTLGALPRMAPRWTLPLLQASACVGLAWVAWSQVRSAPWLEQEMVTRYLARSPFVWIDPKYRGFLPLVQILGGLAWLMQLAAPLVLWDRRLGKYWAALLIVLHGILELFVPFAFWNIMAAISVIPFLPESWLTLKKSAWASQAQELKAAGRGVGFVLLMCVMLCTIFDRNIAEQFDIFEKIGSTKLEKTYEIVTNPFVGIGNLILFNSIWKMYSPTWRHVVWIEWYEREADGKTNPWPQENFSPDYRMHRRTWLEAIWTDFKKEKVFVGMLSGAPERAAYGKYLCHEITEANGRKPLSVHPELFSFDIRGPEENWSLREQKFERTQKFDEVPCD